MLGDSVCGLVPGSDRAIHDSFLSLMRSTYKGGGCFPGSQGPAQGQQWWRGLRIDLESASVKPCFVRSSRGRCGLGGRSSRLRQGWGCTALEGLRRGPQWSMDALVQERVSRAVASGGLRISKRSYLLGRRGCCLSLQVGSSGGGHPGEVAFISQGHSERVQGSPCRCSEPRARLTCPGECVPMGGCALSLCGNMRVNLYYVTCVSLL